MFLVKNITYVKEYNGDKKADFMEKKKYDNLWETKKINNNKICYHFFHDRYYGLNITVPPKIHMLETDTPCNIVL